MLLNFNMNQKDKPDEIKLIQQIVNGMIFGELNFDFNHSEKNTTYTIGRYFLKIQISKDNDVYIQYNINYPAYKVEDEGIKATLISMTNSLIQYEQQNTLIHSLKQAYDSALVEDNTTYKLPKRITEDNQNEILSEQEIDNLLSIGEE